MNIIKRDTLTSNCSLSEFGHYMSQLDLKGVAPEKRARATLDHINKIMIDKIHDRVHANEILGGMMMRAQGD